MCVWVCTHTPSHRRPGILKVKILGEGRNDANDHGSSSIMAISTSSLGLFVVLLGVVITKSLVHSHPVASSPLVLPTSQTNVSFFGFYFPITY